jgi:hypothetical protein
MAALGTDAEDAASRAAIGSSGGCGRDPCGDEDRLDGCDEFELDRIRRTSADAGSSPPPKATGRFKYCAGGICALLGRLPDAHNMIYTAMNGAKDHGHLSEQRENKTHLFVCTAARDAINELTLPNELPRGSVILMGSGVDALRRAFKI